MPAFPCLKWEENYFDADLFLHGYFDEYILEDYHGLP